ncbi:hypothetical protein [Lancefieldella parvula]|uniref:hypothetical protein n=1 Tax=Lancefieldella parvula TaxID=1382 RepID=UPI00288BF49F|nr:hypothetical protein [Lancefieldella parvula]
MANTLAKASNKTGAEIVRSQVDQIQYLMQDVLKEGTHYDTIKGCGDKPVLLQPGAEKIALMFRFVPKYEVTKEDLGNNHREYDVTCNLLNEEGTTVGIGIGLCSTMEKKYRYRKDWNSGGRIENEDIADLWNTVLKMAKKRAFVDAVRSTTAASDIFVQDIEEAPMQPQPTHEQTDLSEIRALYKEWCKAVNIDPQNGTQLLLDTVRASSMETMTNDQVAAAVAAMKQDIEDAAAGVETVEPEPKKEPTQSAADFEEVTF